MSILDEYRRNARECQRMADQALNPIDKASWLRLAASWLGMLKGRLQPTASLEPQKPFANEKPQANEERDDDVTWPEPSDKDSRASH